MTDKNTQDPVHMVRSHGSDCWEEISGESLETCRCQPEEYEVRTLYAEQPAPVAVPDGWKLVPIEPTAEMLSAAERKEWPADWEAGKRLQRLRGLDVVSPRTETECAVGLYGRILEAAPEYDGKVKELDK